jgi:hypothetical protein
MQSIKEVNPHPRIVPCVNMWSVTFFFLFFLFFFLWHLLNVGAFVCHIAWEGHTSIGDRRTNSNCHPLCYSIMSQCYTNSIVSRIHIDTIELRNITCTLVATSVDTIEFRVYNERGGPTASYRWTGLHLRNNQCKFKTWRKSPIILEGSMEYTPKIMKKNCKMSTCTPIGLGNSSNWLYPKISPATGLLN